MPLTNVLINKRNPIVIWRLEAEKSKNRSCLFKTPVPELKKQATSNKTTDNYFI